MDISPVGGHDGFSILQLSVFAVDYSNDDARYTDFKSSLTKLEGYAAAYAR